MTSSGEKLGRKREAAILALLSARSVEDAAHAADIPPRTLYRWLKQPEFANAYRKARHETFAQSTARICQMASAAVTTLGKIMVDSALPAASRVRAADSILSHAVRAMEIEDIDARLAELERRTHADSPRKMVSSSPTIS
jgi:transposase-like protein